MNRKLSLSAALALVALLLPGCPTTEVRTEGKLSGPDVLSIMDARAASLRTLSATLAMKVKLSGMNSTEDLSAYFAAAGPSSIRLRAKHALVDYNVLDLGCNSSTWWVHFHYQDTDRVDFGSLSELDRTNQDIPLRPDQVVAILGMTPIRDTSASYWVFTVHAGYYLLQEVVPDHGSQFVATRITVDSSNNLISRYETLFSNGRTDMSATIEKYQTVSGVSIPRTVHIRLFGQKDEGRLDLDFSEVKVNPVLSEKMFVPPDFTTIKQQFRHPLDRRVDFRPVSSSSLVMVP